jgi:peptidoglycan hydrolase CwlO-like protein
MLLNELKRQQQMLEGQAVGRVEDHQLIARLLNELQRQQQVLDAQTAELARQAAVLAELTAHSPWLAAR